MKTDDKPGSCALDCYTRQAGTPHAHCWKCGRVIAPRYDLCWRCSAEKP